ncbi:MAG: autotransporter-associated beta strand repeat-containing protein, partial [Planctomycetaceae bacterium]|nr:autotransporter-associated beta strand repeat-containing protein [Planctomycetaceae bacterium]
TSVDFLTATGFVDGNDLKVQTQLSWNLQDGTAHGNFTIAGSNSFTLGVELEDKTSADSWDGKTLTKLGSGTLILTGENTYGGDTNVNAGTLKLFGNGSLANSPVNVAADATFDYSESDKQIGGLNTVADSKVALSKDQPVDARGGNANIGAGTIFILEDLIDDFERLNLVYAASIGGSIIGTEDTLYGGLDEFIVKFQNDTTSEAYNILYAEFLSRGLAEEAKTLLEGRIASLAMLKEQQDWLNSYGWQMLVSPSTNGAGKYKMQYFGAFTGAQSRLPSGSHVDLQTYSVHAGLAKNITSKLLLGTSFNGGHGDYKTFNEFTRGNVFGRGEIETYGGAVFAKYNLSGGYYTDGAVYFGASGNKFDTAFNRQNYHYDFNSPYVGVQAGIGRRIKIAPAARGGELDLFARYLGMWEGSENATFGRNTVHFAHGESNRLRLGGRYYLAPPLVCGGDCEPCSAVNTRQIKGYIGAAWDYEFSGTSRGNRADVSILAPSIHGGTAIGEVGLSATLRRVELHTGIEGYLGKREGFSGNVGGVYRF